MIQLTLRRSLCYSFFSQLLMRCYFQLHWNLKLVFSLACQEILRSLVLLLIFQYILRFYHQWCSFFAAINYSVLHFPFLYSSLSMWSLQFLSVLKSFSLVFIFFWNSPIKPFLRVFFYLLGLTSFNIVNNCSYFLEEI